MTISIREATSRDMSALIGLLYESDVLHSGARPDHFDALDEPARGTAFVNHLLNEENGVILIAELEAVVVGLVQLAVFDERSGPYRRKHPCAHIGDIVVASEHRRTGVGRMLMAAADRWAKTRGAEEIVLTVWNFNNAATTLYESLGYQTTKRTLLKPLS